MTPVEKELHTRFLRLFTTNELAIRAYVRRLVPTRSDADDVMQDVSVVLWRKFGDFQTGGNFRAWAFAIARFEALSWRRDKARDRLVLDDEVVAKLADETAEAEPQLQRQREALEGCMQKFPEAQRGLLMQAYQSEHRIQDVARKSGRSIKGFYQWLHRVRGMLLECIHRSLAETI
jgi:RNA polymerase sigma-70 factor (ECF subfamily)